VADAYRSEDAVAALARLRQDNAELQAQLQRLQQRLEGIELRVGVRPPPPVPAPKPIAIVVAALAGALLVGLAGVMYARSSSATSEYLRTHPHSETGVEACDVYMAKWQACYTDPSIRAAVQPGFDRVTEQWRSMAKDGAQRAALEKTCSNLVENFPSAQCAAVHMSQGRATSR
jgi:hypothetical protein